MKKIEAAKNILDIAKESRNKFAVTGTEFDKVQANMYSVFEENYDFLKYKYSSQL